MSEDYDVDTADAGASNTEPVQASTLKRGSYMMINDRPCKVDKISTSKPGKHGSAKCHFVAIDIFTGKKLEEISPAHGTLHSPKVVRKKFQLLYLTDEDYLSLMDEDGETYEHLQLPEDDLGKKIKLLVEDGMDLNIVVLQAMGDEKVVDWEENKM